MTPKLSLAMIVKDEEHNLAQCLDSVAKHVDEIIVVDTGSTDGTREVAKRYGAKVVQFDQYNHPEAFFLDDEATCKAFEAPPPYSGTVALGDFAAARNESFRHVTGDCILWLDADDVLEGSENLRESANDLWSRGLDLGFLAYDYARDHLGRVYYRQWRERLVRRDVTTWVNPVHEVMLPARPLRGTGRYDKPLVSHRRKADRKSIPNRNYKILLRLLHQIANGKPTGAVLDGEIDPRTLFYLGQEARFVEPLRAKDFYEAYLKKSGWPEERAAAHAALGQMLEFGMLGGEPADAYARADMEYAASAAEMPDNPDGLLGMARIAYLRNRWQDCINYTQRAITIGNTDSMLGANPMDRLYRPHVYLNQALAQLGRIDEAIESCKAGLSVCPDDPGVPGGAPGMLKNNLSAYESEKAKLSAPKGKEMVSFDKNEDLETAAVSNIPRDAIVIWAMQIWKQIRDSHGGDRALTFLDSIPDLVTLDPVVARMRESTVRRFPKAKSDRTKAREALEMARAGAAIVKHGLLSQESKSNLSVVIYTGACFEDWTPDSPNARGLGGSETACIEVAKHLVLLGHKVTVYSECGMGGTWDGVQYVNHKQFVGTDCDVFISSRAPWAIEHFGPVNARLKLLWVHDIHCGPSNPQMERWLLGFDRVLCLSEWHKDFFCSTYSTLHPDRVTVTRNGIDPARFENETEKKNRLVFSSSPNRGLDLLLHNFRHIRSQVPDAELHIYYGFDCWETMARASGDQASLHEIKRYRGMIDDAVKRGGVFWHGRVSQKELAEAYLSAKVWPYLTGFTETYCITALEAMAAGAVPVCSNLAALSETVKHGIKIDLGPGCEQKWIDSVVSCLRDEAYRRSIAEAGRKYALTVTWESLAREWSSMFDHLIGEVERNPIPLWRAA